MMRTAGQTALICVLILLGGVNAYPTGTGDEMCSVIEQLPGVNVYDACVRDGNAFVVDYAAHKVTIYRVADPEELVPLAEISTPNPPDSVCVVGDHLFVGENVGDLLIFDISDVTNPVQCGAVSQGFDAVLGIAQGGNLLFLGVDIYGIAVYDISDPCNPVYLSNVGSPGYVDTVAVDGNHLYAAARPDGLQIFEILQEPPYLNHVGGCCGNGSDWGLDVYVHDGFAYLAKEEGGVDVIDVTDPANPAFVTNIPVSQHGGLDAAVGVDGFANGRDSWLYIAIYTGLVKVDITDPANPVEVDFIRTDGDGAHSAHDVLAYGNVLLLANGPGGLWVIADGPFVAASGCSTAPLPGSTVVLRLNSLCEANFKYVAAASYEPSPGIALPDGRVIPLKKNDPLFGCSRHGQCDIEFYSMKGRLSGTGRQYIVIKIPDDPSWKDRTFYVDFVTASGRVTRDTVSSVGYPPCKITVGS